MKKVAIIASLVVVAVVGCAGFFQWRAWKLKELKARFDLKIIGLAFHNWSDMVGKDKAPSKIEDLEPLLQADRPIALQHLKDGEYVFLWNVSLDEMKERDGLSWTVLCYERQTPERGGQVLYGDGSVKHLSAAEFHQAKKATNTKEGGKP
jgi:hypothetical protein